MKTARTAPSPGANGNVVTATGLTRRYGAGTAAVDALRGVSLAVNDGELVGIMGPSGSGKSTLLHILAGLDRPTSGEVAIGTAGQTNARDRARTERSGLLRVVREPARDPHRVGREPPVRCASLTPRVSPGLLGRAHRRRSGRLSPAAEARSRRAERDCPIFEGPARRHVRRRG